jgi:hypothetical protein
VPLFHTDCGGSWAFLLLFSLMLDYFEHLVLDKEEQEGPVERIFKLDIGCQLQNKKPYLI